MKQFWFAFCFMLCASTVFSAEKPVLLDDTLPNANYYTSKKAQENWDEFGKETDYRFGYGNREMNIIFGKITGGDCKDNKSWLVSAMNRYPEVVAKGLLHVDAICAGKRIIGDLDYATDVDPQKQYLNVKTDGGNLWQHFTGMLNVDGQNMQVSAQSKFTWKWDDERPDLESNGKVSLSIVNNQIDGFPDEVNLGDWNPKTISWEKNNPYKSE